MVCDGGDDKRSDLREEVGKSVIFLINLSLYLEKIELNIIITPFKLIDKFGIKTCDVSIHLLFSIAFLHAIRFHFRMSIAFILYLTKMITKQKTNFHI